MEGKDAVLTAGHADQRPHTHQQFFLLHLKAQPQLMKKVSLCFYPLLSLCSKVELPNDLKMAIGSLTMLKHQLAYQLTIYPFYILPEVDKDIKGVKKQNKTKIVSIHKDFQPSC